MNLEADHFTNEFGQVIRSGDEVVIVTTGYGHYVSTTKGVFVGRHKNGGVQVIVDYRNYTTVDDDGNPVPYNRHGANKYGYVNGKRITTLQLNRVYKLA